VPKYAKHASKAVFLNTPFIIKHSKSTQQSPQVRYFTLMSPYKFTTKKHVGMQMQIANAWSHKSGLLHIIKSISSFITADASSSSGQKPDDR
jgi:hypothetical protein